MTPLERARDELAWLGFFVPRQAVQWLARRLPLARLRDALPAIVGERLRFGLYPARVTDATEVVCARAHAPWGTPARLDPARPVHYDAAPRASILIVTYNNVDLTRLCLASVQRAAGVTPFEIIAVDNQSQDSSTEYLRQCVESKLLPIKLIENNDNRGFAAANNQAAKEARGDVLIFLNNDTVVTPGWLDRMVTILDEDPSIGLLGPVTNSCGNEAQLGTHYTDLTGMFGFASDYTTAHKQLSEELPMLTLFCAAMRRDLYQTIGGLDERYVVGMFEDDDLAMAVRARGRRVVLARDVFVHHYGGAAFSRLPGSRYLRIWWENRRRFERKWGRAWQKR